MKSRDVYIFVFDGMADWEPISAACTINNSQSERRHRVRTVALSTGPVTTTSGRRIQPDLSVSQVKLSHGAVLILPDGDLWSTGDCGDILSLAREFRIRGLSVAAVSAATLALARAGMLDDFHHTGNSRACLAATGYRGASFYCDVPAIADEGLITASQSAPLEFAREIAHELGLHSQPSLDAWHALHRLGDASGPSRLLPCVTR